MACIEAIKGLIEGDFEKMDARSVKGIINKGGTILKSARSKNLELKKVRKKPTKP
jgi:6-phosphofructokinase 1